MKRTNIVLAMPLENETVGKLNLVLLSLFFTYYTVWVIVLPFVDADYLPLVHRFFPPVEVALGVPALVGSTAFLLLLIRAYYLVRKDRKTNKKEE